MQEKEAFKRLVRLMLSGVCLAGQVLIYIRFLYMYFFEPIKRNLQFFEKGEALFIAIYAVLLLFQYVRWNADRLSEERRSDLFADICDLSGQYCDVWADIYYDYGSFSDKAIF